MHAVSLLENLSPVPFALVVALVEDVEFKLEGALDVQGRVADDLTVRCLRHIKSGAAEYSVSARDSGHATARISRAEAAGSQPWNRISLDLRKG